jgi:hypothetical protein
VRALLASGSQSAMNAMNHALSMGQVSFQGVRQVVLLAAISRVTNVSGLLCYLSIRFGPRSFRYATMSSTSSSVSTMRPPKDREPTGSCASVKLKNR